MSELSDSPIADSWVRYRKTVVVGEPPPEMDEWFRMCFYGGASFMFATMIMLITKHIPPDVRVQRDLALAWRLIQLELDSEIDLHTAILRGKK